MNDTTQLKSIFSSRENERTMRNSIHLSINETLKTNVLKLTTEIKIHASKYDLNV